MRKNIRLLRYADGVILHDEELIPYLPVLKKNIQIHIVPLRMDLSPFIPVYPEVYKKIITIVHAPSHRGVKGTESVLAAIRNLEKKYELEFILVENLPNAQALEIYKSADIVVDQLRSSSYGVFSIEAMALGKPVIVSIIDDVRKTYPPDLPIVNANVNTIEPALEKLIVNGMLRNELGRAGRKYAEQYHDCRKISKLLLKVYKNEHKSIFGPEAYEEVKNIQIV
jgi:glycosyltransferase involved in cell wall biosynthesis